MRDTLDRIDRHLESTLSLKALAETAHLSLPRFKARFKTEIGIAPHEYILRKKIERAKIMLQKNRTSIAVVANVLGFPSSQYFSTVFRRFTGKTPKFFFKRDA